MERALVNPTEFPREQVAALWQACWELWEDREEHQGEPWEAREERWASRAPHGQDRRILLGAFMASMKAVNPWLPGQPTWIALRDVEEE